VTAGGRLSRGRASRLPLLLSAGAVDSVGLAFGWTVFLLAVAERDGPDAAIVQYAAALVGVAASGPVSARLARRLAPRDLLRMLAVGEGACRVGLFVLFLGHAPVPALAALVAVMNVLAWCGFAAMRTEVSRAQGPAGAGAGADGAAGRLLTLYAVAILTSEALATALASVVLSSAPPAPVLAVVATVYGMTLVPQWVVGTYAPRERPVAASSRAPWRVVAVPCGVGGVVFLLAAAPAMAATVLAFERYGRAGVLVSALSFAVGAAGAARVQSVVGRWRTTAAPAFVLGALMVGGWALSGTGLAGLAVAQVCAGVAQCALEGDLDARAVARTGPAASTSALALASSSRALGGALAVYLLPTLADAVSLPVLCGATACGLAVAAAACGIRPRRAAAHVPRPRSAPSAERGAPRSRQAQE
jgi:hypothetical protein